MIRSYEPSDAASCALVIAASATGMDGLNEAARRMAAAKSTPDHAHSDLGTMYTVVHVQDGDVNGVGALDEDEIKRLYVAPEVQGHGIGTRLCDALEAEATKRAVPHIQVEASPSSVGFYASRGYSIVGDRQLVVDDAIFDVVEVRLDLNRSEDSLR